MAGRSKKALKGMKTQQSVIRIYKTAIYIRLSVEDMRKKTADSIGTQKAMLEDFVRTQPDLKLYNVYEDVNYTGTNYNRPGFMRMIEDIQSGLVDCVVVKDLSRFGRNFKETGNFLERVFPFLNVRFISVNDSYDSLTASLDESGLIVPLKNLMNEVYARDCSKKIKSGFQVKQQRGEFCGAFAPYGYIKAGQSLVVDEETAPIVKMIYKWRLEGIGFSKICQRLNEMKILPPSRYRFVKGITKAKKHEETMFWYPSAVKRILQNPAYIGTLAQARYKSNFLQGGGVIETKKEEWIVVENTHPAIIDKDTYEAVQKTSNCNSNKVVLKKKGTAIKRWTDINGTADDDGNIFRGLIICGDCGKHMHRSKRRTKYTYVCSIYLFSDKHACTMKPFKEAALRAAVFSALSAEIKLAVDMNKLISKLKKNKSYQKQKDTLEDKINELQKKLNDIQDLKKTFNDDCKAGLLSEEDCAILIEDFNEKSNRLQNELDNMSNDKQRENAVLIENKWLLEFMRFEKEEKLTAEMLRALVQRVIIYDNKRLEIIMLYRDAFEELQKYIKDMK